MKSKILLLFSAIIMLTSCSAGIDADRFFSMNFYETEVIPATTYLERGEIAAVEFYAADEFSGIELLAAKVGDDDTLSVTLYEFNTDYATTLKDGKKVESATFRDYENRDSLLLSFKTISAGKYLLTFSTKSNAGICVAAYPSEQAKDNVVFYLNGEPYNNGAYYAAILFNGNRLDKNYFQNTSPVETPPSEELTEPQKPEDSPAETPDEPTEDPENGGNINENLTDLPGYVPESVN